ncbi:hypothetical protein SMKI_12G4040 [Saccharomyces mikatae IFO 1815]|uniref:Bud8p n=1 Tax=Saccharomyces mikatae IFO 1815 TaxID=226126 RepID=A0AA35ISV1_SACMI|nr:uncharacterized protein SMKI_12G4040 [Saccharomyces mikatae IFO 1815]CAI4035254.1 hypothetical protein SMKI_12G4040 [Saccharomyces mikatae IFO 1815]
MIQSDEDNFDSSETTESTSYSSSSSASIITHPRTSLFLENIEGTRGNLDAEIEMATVAYESTSRGQGFAVYINNERFSQIMGASTSSSSSSDSSSITQFHDTHDNNIPSHITVQASLRRDNEEGTPSRKVTPSQNVAIRPERTLNSPSSQRLSCALTISTSVLMGEDAEGSPLEQEHSRVVSSLYSSLANRGNDEPKNGTPSRPTSSGRNETMEHSFFSYHYDDTLEPDVEEAVKLTKNKISSVNFISTTDGQDRDGSQDKDIEQNELVTESKFIPHKLKIPEKAGSIKSSISDESYLSGVPGTAVRMIKIPQSPSLIGNILIPLHERDTGNEGSSKDYIKLNNEELFRSSSMHKPSSSLEEEGPPIGVPSIPVLRSVSGSSKWAKTSQLLTFKNSSKFDTCSPHEGHTSSSPLSETNNSKSKALPEHGRSIVLAPIKSQSSESCPEEIPTIERPARSLRPTNQEKKDSRREDNDDGRNIDLEARLPIQHIDTSSIHSFDSVKNGFKDVYSIESIIVVILCCVLVPPLFFIIGCGSRSKLLSDYRLMRLLMNKEHRAALLQGFIWDVDLKWFRMLCLILGAGETIIVMAGIAIGFGVGITREDKSIH